MKTIVIATRIASAAVGLALSLPGVSTTAKAAYKVNDLGYPVTYSDAQKSAQRDAGRAIVKQIKAATAAGDKSFTVPPGVYRIPAQGPDNLLTFTGVKSFTLNLANTEFIMENGGGFIYARDSENLAFSGPVKIDADPLVYTQGKISAYDAETGLTTVEIMPGYEVSDSAKGTVDAFSTAGIYLENPSWAGYQDARVISAEKRLVQVKLGHAGIARKIYQPGNLIVLRLHGSPLLLSTERVNGLTLQDVDVYTGSGISWGSGKGDYNFIRVRGIPRPGTNRLYGSGGCQRGSYGGNVLFDGCEFSVTADDLMDYGGGGTFMNLRQESPRQLITWRGSYSVGDTLNFYSHTDFHWLGSAEVTALTEIKDAALQAQAREVVKNINKGRDTGAEQPLRRATLDRDVKIEPGDFVDNATSNRADQFTIRNCYFHDAGVRVMIQGFKHGLFENNRFERISGGLAMGVDAWWWGGPAAQDITIRNNVFRQTTFRNEWGTGRAAIEITAGEGPRDPTQGVAIHRINITGNRFTDSSNAAIIIGNAADVTVKDNVIDRPFTLGNPLGSIQLRSVDKAQVEGNIVTGCPGPNIAVKNSNGLNIRRNLFVDCYQKPGSPAQASPNAVISIVGCTNTTVANNMAAGTDALYVIWVAGSAHTHLVANNANWLSAPGAALVGTGDSNTDLRNTSGP